MRVVPQEPTAFVSQGSLEEEILRAKPKSITGAIRLAVIRSRTKQRAGGATEHSQGETHGACQNATSQP